MADFYQDGVLTTLHRLAHDDVDRLEAELSRFVSNRPITPDTSKDFEKAIADIQLFGAASQVELAREFAVRFARDGTAPLDPLLSALRHDLREELLLDDIPREITYLRMTFDPQRKSAAPSFPPKRE